MSIPHKICSTCNNSKVHAEFWKDKKRKDGLYYECKACAKARNKKWMEENREYREEYIRAWYENNAEYAKKYSRNWRENNAEHVKKRDAEYKKKHRAHYYELKRQWYANNPDKVKAMKKREYEKHRDDYIRRSRKHYQDNIEQKRAYRKEKYRENYEQNKEEILKANREWQKKNPRRCLIIVQNRRARIKKADGTHNIDDIKKIYKSQAGKCAYCGGILEEGYHVDHIIPLSRGGANSPDNLCCACPTCNLTKNNKLLSEWVDRWYESSE